MRLFILFLFVIIFIILVIVGIILLLSRNTKKTENYDDIIEEIDEETLNRFFPEARFELWINHYIYIYYNHKKYFYKHKDNPSKYFQYLCNNCVNEYIYFWFSKIHPWVLEIRPNKNYYFIFSTWDGIITNVPIHLNSNDYKTLSGINDIYKFQDLRQKHTYLLPFYHTKRYIGGFSRHINDPYGLCILDPFFVQNNGYTFYLENQWKNTGFPWKNKINKIVFRGHLSNGSFYNFIDRNTDTLLKSKGHRYYLYNLRTQYNDILDFNDNNLSPQEMSRFRYLLDIDGHTNAWSALIWKLNSGSIVLKQKSIWEQWFYYKLKPFVHYIPIENDFSNLRQMFDWCESHIQECELIIQNAQDFISNELSFNSAIQDMKTSLLPYFSVL